MKTSRPSRTASAAPAATADAPSSPAVPKKIRTPDPVLDHKTAKSVTPYRDEKSGRTIGNHQPAGETGVHRFSPTGNFIDTVTAEEAAKFEPKPAEPAPAPAPADPAPGEVAPIPETPAAS